MNAVTTSIRRSRLGYALAVVLLIASGLLLRSGVAPFPPVVVKYGGVALWAIVLFLGLGLAFASAPTLHIACVAVGISWCVEFLQLYHSTWIDAIRSPRIGHLVLGSTFHGPDLVAYCFGVCLVAVAEVVFSRQSRSAQQRA
jgi:hypothetical protein